MGWVEMSERELRHAEVLASVFAGRLTMTEHSIFRVSKPQTQGGQGMTQFGRAMSELNIEILCTNLSQAKGRVERVNRTLQDRLVKKLRFEGI